MSKCKTCSQKFAVFHGKNIFFSCYLVCISMTRAFQYQSALENKSGIPASDAWRWHTMPPVYRLPTPQGSLRKAGIPASDVLWVKLHSQSLNPSHRLTPNILHWNHTDFSSWSPIWYHLTPVIFLSSRFLWFFWYYWSFYIHSSSLRLIWLFWQCS